jgi:septal ring factor EnvC (AmiA/AmiB activator)
MSYMTGRQEILKLLLSQEDPADFGRMLVYYDYLNRHRTEQINAVEAQLMRLEQLARESAEVVSELERLRTAQSAEAARLEQQRGERQALIAEINLAIDSSGTRIERMRAEEESLKETLARLAEVLEDFPVSSDEPFSAQRGRLTYPVEGRIAANFGDFRTSARRIRRTGVLIAADAGTVVRAVYHGRVILSQWASGMGLLVVINHGEGYFTLYGHNAVLLAEPGDWVQAGEPIAEVGDSGGQQGSGVHFEITFNGVPVDPGDWVR